MPPTLWTWLLLLTGVAALATAAPLIKLAADAPTLTIAAVRLGVAAAILLTASTVLRGRPLRLAAGSLPGLLLAGFFLAAHFLCWIASLKHTSVVSSVVIVTMNPIFVGLASWRLFGERPSRWMIVGIALAACGAGLIALGDHGTAAQPHALYGDLLALAGGLMASCYLLTGRYLRRRLDALSYNTGVYAVAAVLLLGAALLRGVPLSGFTPRTWLCLILLAVVPQVIGHSILNWALKHLTATMVTVLILGEPVGAGLIAGLALHEPPDPAQAVGGALILAGITCALRRSERSMEPGSQMS